MSSNQQSIPSDPAAIERAIRDRQQSLASTVDELVERVQPKNLAETAKVTAKEKAMTLVGMAKGHKETAKDMARAKVSQARAGAKDSARAKVDQARGAALGKVSEASATARHKATTAKERAAAAARRDSRGSASGAAGTGFGSSYTTGQTGFGGTDTSYSTGTQGFGTQSFGTGSDGFSAGVGGYDDQGRSTSGAAGFVQNAQGSAKQAVATAKARLTDDTGNPDQARLATVAAGAASAMLFMAWLASRGE